MDWTPAVISVGAMMGALGRHYTNQLGLTRQGFPLSTLVVNLSGAALMGFWVTLLRGQLTDHPELPHLLLVGWLGAYTTFSTYIADTDYLSRAHSRQLGLLYGVGTPLVGLVSFGLGRSLALWLGQI
ncbi:MAG: CrcB family protein [Cyanobacteria bacterium REEB459]|nr:CrcB family protein [Cyanobacteria bacterium REEB459]